MTPTQKYTEFAQVKGEHVEIIGESFEQPVHKSSELEMYSRIRFVHKKIEIWPTRYFGDELSYNDLKKNVEYFKKEMIKEWK